VSKSLRDFPSALSLRDSSISSEYQTSLDKITAAQLLPIAATIVAAGTGAEVAGTLPNPQHALGTLITSYVMWGMGVPLAMTVLVMYYQRLALHKLPPREVIVSCFLPLGPLGMGGYTITYLGKVSRENFAQTHIISDVAGEVVYILGFFVALIMWGFGLVWLVFALATIYKCQPFPFNMGWWGFTFPLGVYAISTITFGVEMPSQFFKIFGTVSVPLPIRSVRSLTRQCRYSASQ
jgi:tellurite resistance protein TehA-like permease